MNSMRRLGRLSSLKPRAFSYQYPARYFSDKPHRFTKDHEWISKPDSDNVSIGGITDYAQHSLGEIVFVELPSVGDSFEANETFGQIESVKAASELLMPISGEIVAVNDDLQDNPGLVNSSPESDAWMIKIKISDASQMDEMMDKNDYDKFLEELE